MNQFTEQDMCEECLEYTCEHKYPILKLDGECPICYETLTSDNTIILDKCKHCFTEDCILGVLSLGIIKCPVCRQSSRGYKSYLNVKIELSNLVLPPIGVVSFESYFNLFNKYKCCIYPTKEMIKYIEEGQELYDGILNKKTLSKEKKRLYCKTYF
jgi:hypothetical protein